MAVPYFPDMKKISMKHLLMALYSFSAAVLTLLLALRFIPSDTVKLSVDAQSFALIELFTSVNCPGCPAAEKVVQQIRDPENQDHPALYILAFHVDYRNLSGARDPFSSEAFTQYQQYYSHALRLRGLFTPQMVVNGLTSFEGNDLDICRERIESVLETKPKETIDIRATATFFEDSIEIAYKLSRPLNNMRLNIALVQKSARMDMRSGENAGLLFDCFNIVRSFEHISGKDVRNGRHKLHLPRDLSPEDIEIVLYTQNSLTYSISGATRI